MDPSAFEVSSDLDIKNTFYMSGIWSFENIWIAQQEGSILDK